MKNEFADEKLTGILDKLTGALPAQVEARAVREMANARPVGARSRRRLIAIAVGAAVVLFGLGFVPFPAGSAKGAWAQAMAAIEKAKTLHWINEWQDERGLIRQEMWQSKDGFVRSETRINGELESLTIEDENRQISYDSSSQSESISNSQPFWYRPIDFGSGYNGNEIIGRLERLTEGSTGTIKESRITKLWGRTLDIVELTGAHDGDQPKCRAIIDSETNLIESLEWNSIPSGGHEATRSMEYFEWNVPVPKSAQEFTPPKGTTVKRYKWWDKRLGEVIAEEETADWKVILHALDVNKKGHIFASLTDELTPGSNFPPISRTGVGFRLLAPSKVEAWDDLGGHYTKANYESGGVPVLIRDTPLPDGELPRRLTLTAYPRYEEAPDQFVTLRDLALPLRQQGDELVSEDVEVTQY